MLIATSKVTRQGQISVPAQVRRDLGVREGTELVWERNQAGSYTVRPKRATLAEVHRLVGEVTVRLTDEEIRQARREFRGNRAKRAGVKRG